MTDEEFERFISNDAPQNATILKYLIVTRNKLREYRQISVGYSGGSDSDIVIDLIELVKPPEAGEIHYVFYDTGLEWDATKRHVQETAEKYGVTIETRMAVKPIPVACKEYGVPFISKECSNKIRRLQRHGFKFDVDIADYENNKGGNEWWNGTDRGRYSASALAFLKDFMMQHPPDYKISEECCTWTKKKVAERFAKEHHIELSIDGQRQAEGGGACWNWLMLLAS